MLADIPIPNGVPQVVLFPAALTLLGAIIFYFGWSVQNRLTKAPWKWLAILPLGYALYLGINYVLHYSDPIYSNLVNINNGDKKMLFAHWAAFGIPTLTWIWLIAFHIYNVRLNLDLHE